VTISWDGCFISTFGGFFYLYRCGFRKRVCGKGHGIYDDDDEDDDAMMAMGERFATLLSCLNNHKNVEGDRC